MFVSRSTEMVTQTSGPARQTTMRSRPAGTVRSDDGAAVGLLGDIVAGNDVGQMRGLVPTARWNGSDTIAVPSRRPDSSA